MPDRNDDTVIIIKLQTTRWEFACAVRWLQHHKRKPAYGGNSYFWCYGGRGLGDGWKDSGSGWLPLSLAEYLPRGNRSWQEWRTPNDAMNAAIISIIRFRRDHDYDPT